LPALFAAVVVLLAAASSPAEAPPPDPTRGEPADGRIEDFDRRQAALAVPRLVLLPLRVVVLALSYPTRALVLLYDRYHLGGWFLAATTTADGLRGVRPEFSWDLRFLFAAGLSYFDRRTLGPGTSLSVRVLTGGADIVEAGLSLRPTHEKARAQLRIDLTYLRRDDQYFNGIGLEHEGSRYAIDAVALSHTLRVRLAAPLQLLAGADAAFKRFGDGDLIGGDRPITEVYCVRVVGRCVPGTVSPTEVPGFDRGTQFLRGSVGLLLDTRDAPFRPSSGFQARAVVEYTHGLGFDESSYFKITGSTSAVVGLWQHSHVLVLRANASVLEPTNDVPIPFSELIVLGGPDSLRGFRPGSLRDESLLLFTAEYRWPIWMFADATLFVDYGGTFARNFHQLEPSQLYWDLGVGLRVATRGQFFFRAGLAYGFSGGGLQVLLSGGGGP
jgi:outer membrane protein assembly factor BamA